VDVLEPVQEPLNIRWDVSMLNKLIGYVFKKSKSINNLNLRNVQKLLKQCNYEPYANRPVVMERVKFILKALDARLDKRYEDDAIILEYCTPDFENPAVDEILKNLDRYRSLNYKEIEFITNFVEDRLIHGALINRTEALESLLERVKDGEFVTYAEANAKILEWIRDYLGARRKISTVWNTGMLDFNDPNVEERVSDIVARLGDRSSIIITGIQMLNEMLSPGFRPGKLYVFLGVTGGYKSAMLLKIVLDCAKYNAKTFKPKHEGAKPYILYLTMENTIDESFARVWNMAVENTDVERSKPSDIVAKLKEKKIVGNDDIGILFAYRPNMSITTDDIRDIIDEIEMTGKEIIMLSFDYIKRILPHQKARDEKEMLKNITNELRQIAIDYQIPVASAHQFNRSALATINAGARDNKADLGRFVGGENVGSAFEVMENPDMTIGLNLERKRDTGVLYLSFNRLKERYRPSTKLTYFNQPFQMDNEFSLRDDILLAKPLGIISLDSDMEGANADMLFNSRGRSMHKNPLMDKDMITDDIFDLEPV
jgi:replicative DNA helicase